MKNFRLNQIGQQRKRIDKIDDDDDNSNNNNDNNNINFDDSDDDDDDDDDNNVGGEKLRRKYSNLRRPIIPSNDNGRRIIPQVQQPQGTA